MDTKLTPWTEQEWLKWKIWLYKEGLRAENPAFSKTVTSSIRWYEAIFDITAGPLKIWATIYKETYVLEIRYEDSYRKHSEQLNLAGFGSVLFSDYAQRVNEIALEYIQQQGWTLNDHINSWPEFQAIVTIKPNTTWPDTTWTKSQVSPHVAGILG